MTKRININMKFLNAGCGTHYAEGWVNTDVWEDANTKPDIRVEAGKPYPFEDDTFDAVFMGHVLEHMPWPDVPKFLSDMKRIAKPGAQFLVVGPDVFRAIDRYAAGQEPAHIVKAVLEHQDMNYQPGRENEWWDGAHHHWNCHNDRVAKLLSQCGFSDIKDVFNIIPQSPQMRGWSNEGIDWPVVGFWRWQFGILCKNSK